MLSPSPILLPSSTITYTVAEAAAQTIKNPTTPIRNDQPVGVAIDRLVVRAASGNRLTLALRLTWRDMPITNGFVMVDSMAWVRNYVAEQVQIQVIRFPKPLYLPPGEFLNMDVQSIDSAADVAPYDFTAVGLQAPEPDPLNRFLPYFSGFRGATYTINGGAPIVDQSVPNDLGNPFDVPLRIERLVGRVQTGGTPLFDRNLSPAWNTYSLRISDHLDRFWVPTPATFTAIFGGERAWIVNHDMEPKGFLRVEFEGTANAADASGTNQRVALGLAGYRRIA